MACGRKEKFYHPKWQRYQPLFLTCSLKMKQTTINIYERVTGEILNREEREQRWTIRKARPAEAAGLVAELIQEDWVTFCIEGTVKKTTASKYHKRWENLCQFAIALGKRSVDEDVFLRFLYVLYALEYSSSTVEDYRSAAVKQLQMFEKEPRNWWAQSPRMRLIVAGLKKRMYLNSKRPRGAITGDLLVKIIPTLPPSYVVGFVSAYYGLLRHGDVVKLRVRDVRERSTGSSWLTIFGGKGRLAEELEWVDVSEATSLLKDHIRGRDPDESLFPMWDPEKANEFVRICSIELKWDLRLWWTFHSLRHGRAVDLRSAGITAKELKVRGRWRSSTNELYQAFPDHEEGEE